MSDEHQPRTSSSTAAFASRLLDAAERGKVPGLGEIEVVQPASRP